MLIPDYAFAAYCFEKNSKKEKNFFDNEGVSDDEQDRLFPRDSKEFGRPEDAGLRTPASN